jgi:hypothetical protein
MGAPSSLGIHAAWSIHVDHLGDVAVGWVVGKVVAFAVRRSQVVPKLTTLLAVPRSRREVISGLLLARYIR